MTVEIESSIDVTAPTGMRVYAIAKAYQPRDGRVLLTAECRSEQEFNSAIDLLIRSLTDLKLKAKMKFDEFDKR